ncbi:chorismate mutase [Atractiella rhizophila]|nr:chorismate mutase [Atractiella rhizophila]
MSVNFFSKDPLDLSAIRATLIRLEDTIIFSLIERAQFSHNPNMYKPTREIPQFKDMDFDGTWLDWFLAETEAVHAKCRRYESPDEHPFTERSKLPNAILPAINYPTVLHPQASEHVNVNGEITKFYIDRIVPNITKEATAALGGGSDDDGNYGSAVTRDIECLQALSRRIHFGMFVSESKFRDKPSDFIPHIELAKISSPSSEEYKASYSALDNLIYKPAVEAALLKRLAKKARIYGSDLNTESGSAEEAALKVDVEEVVGLYKDWVIPLTKKVEVDYLLRRLEGLSAEEIEKLRSM